MSQRDAAEDEMMETGNARENMSGCVCFNGDLVILTVLYCILMRSFCCILFISYVLNSSTSSFKTPSPETATADIWICAVDVAFIRANPVLSCPVLSLSHSTPLSPGESNRIVDTAFRELPWARPLAFRDRRIEPGVTCT